MHESHCLLTCLQTEHLQTALSEKGHYVKVSTSAGDYICNYTYYNSLRHREATNDKVYSFFCHVPDFDEIDEKSQ